MKEWLERYFEFRALGTNWRTEVLAGLTTFMTMAYIVFVNPAILSETGMPVAAVTAATCLSAAIGSILMGAYARYPIALAPGMGLNAYFTYAVVKGMGVAWQTALGAVFLSGVVFLVLTLLGLRQLILEAIPTELFAAVAVGIGLFIALIGLKNAGVVVANPATFVGLGNLRDPAAALAVAGFLITASLAVWGVRANILLGILATTGLGAVAGLVRWNPQTFNWGAMGATAFQLDVRGAMKLGLAEIVFVFLFVDMFDNIGTLVGVGKKAGLFDEASRIPRITRILTSDALATITGSLTGTSTVVSYIESASGVAAGGRSGVTAIVAGVLFLTAMFLAPMFGAIPAAATAAALILVGSMMISHAAEIAWGDPMVAVPAFLTIVTIPLTFSIANGLSFGFVSYVVLRMVRGRFQEVNWLAYVLTVLLVLRFVYLGKG